jgi:hypothetical protein
LGVERISWANGDTSALTQRTSLRTFDSVSRRRGLLGLGRELDLAAHNFKVFALKIKRGTLALLDQPIRRPRA